MILTTQNAVATATYEDCAATHLALTGEPLPPVDISGARTRLSNIMLANSNHQGHCGVPPNSAPPPVRTLDQLAAAGVPLDMAALNPYKAGTLLHEVKARTLVAPPCERRAQIVKARDKPERSHAGRGRRVGWRAVPGGVSSVRATSSRGMVLAAVRAATERGAPATEEAISRVCAAQPGFIGSVRQHLQKLLEVAHITPVHEESGA